MKKQNIFLERVIIEAFNIKENCYLSGLEYNLKFIKTTKKYHIFKNKSTILCINNKEGEN